MTGRSAARNAAITSLVLAAIFLAGCETAPMTGRRQLMLVSSAQEMQLGADAYKEVLSKEKEVPNHGSAPILQRVGQRIAAVSDQPSFQWEFKLIQSEQVNAWALPGGKIAFYTGILPYLKNEAGMAAVMAHEVGHAIARHGAERMSHQILVGVGQEVLKYGMKDSKPESQAAVLAVYGLGANVGVLLPYSRKQEYEADQIGLMLMAKAGYDPEEAVRFWQDMVARSGSNSFDLLSTHPADDKRIAELKSLMPKAKEEYAKAAHKYGAGAVLPLK